MVWRLEGAVEVSDSEMLSKVASLRKLDLRSSEAECRVRFPLRASWNRKCIAYRKKCSNDNVILLHVGKEKFRLLEKKNILYNV